MPSQLETIIERLEAIYTQHFPDLQTVAHLTPRQAPTPPTVIITTGQATYRQSGTDSVVVTRQFQALFLEGTAFSEFDGQLEAKAISRIDPAQLLFLKRPGLELNGGDAVALRSRITQDSGAGAFEYPAQSGQWYIGVLFTHSIEYYLAVAEVL